MKEECNKLFKEIEEELGFFQEIGFDYFPRLHADSSEEISKEKFISSLEQEVKKCRACSLAKTRKNAVLGEGNIETDLMFVGEGPGRDEDIQGKPFVGKAGQLLTRIIKAMKFEREDVYITNVIKCRPPENRNPRASEIEKCQRFLLKQIELISPKIIVTLGNVPTRYFLNKTAGITSLRGRFYPYHDIRIMPTFHPSYLVRNEDNKELKKMVWEDMKKVMAALGKK
ncbi:MAG: uracil-DNA glycosylase [Acidobacteriota bacterium]